MPGDILPGRWQPPLLLHDQILIAHLEKGGFQMPVSQEPTPVLQAGQAHGPQAPEGQFAEVTLLMAIAEGDGQHFLSQPTVQLAELPLVVHVFQIVIDDGHGTEGLGDYIAGDIHGQLCACTGVALIAEAALFASESGTEEVAYLAAFFRAPCPRIGRPEIPGPSAGNDRPPRTRHRCDRRFVERKSFDVPWACSELAEHQRRPPSVRRLEAHQCGSLRRRVDRQRTGNISGP